MSASLSLELDQTQCLAAASRLAVALGKQRPAPRFTNKGGGVFTRADVAVQLARKAH